MSALDKALVVLVTSGAEWVRPHVKALRARGAHLRVCSGGAGLREVLTALEWETIVLADVEGGVRGLARALREDHRLRSVPVVALLAPGESQESGVDLAFLNGADPEETGTTVESLVVEYSSRRTAAVVSSEPPSGPLKDGRISEVAAGIHDVRTLLGVIVGYASNLRDGAVGFVSEAHRDHVQKMIEAATDATDILQEVSRATRRVAMGLPLPTHAPGPGRARIDASAVVLTTVRMFGRAAEERGIVLTCAAPQPVQLWANRVHLKQILANLIVNALKFTPRGGRVLVSTRLVPEGRAEIQVSDTGPGIPEEDRTRIFEPGVRLERDACVPGTGLGLAVVRELVVAGHGGTIRVEDGGGGGAEFVVSLPVDTRSCPPEAP